MRALVADDDPEMLDMVSEIIAREFGVTVARAETGAELLDLVADDEPFDFIITDISMPWMTGLQVMHAARTAGLPVPVVVMTALREPRIAHQVETLGIRARLLRKPFSLVDLVVAVHEVLRAVPPASVLRSSRARSD